MDIENTSNNSYYELDDVDFKTEANISLRKRNLEANKSESKRIRKERQRISSAEIDQLLDGKENEVAPNGDEIIPIDCQLMEFDGIIFFSKFTDGNSVEKFDYNSINSVIQGSKFIALRSWWRLCVQTGPCSCRSKWALHSSGKVLH